MKLKTFIEIFGQLDPEIELSFFNEGTEIYIKSQDWEIDEFGKVMSINIYMNED